MVAQAKADSLLFITHDSLIPGYNEPCILAVQQKPSVSLRRELPT